LPQLSRLASATGDFLPYRDGADFAGDLANNRCAPSGTYASLTPDYVAPHKSLSDAAYCLYRLELDPAQPNATLTLVWSIITPASAECWVGLSNWGRGVWEWQPLTSNAIEIGNPAAYADAAKRCYVALVVLGNTQVELVSISFGPLPPPPSNGYTLFAPMADTSTYLIDDKGTVVHSWPGQYMPGACAMLDENGNLWRQLNIFNPYFQFGCRGGRLEEVDWEGHVTWPYELSTSTQCTHHSFELLPNGNILLIVWNWYTEDEAIAAGRDPSSVTIDGLYVDEIFEVEPTQPKATIVWQWRIMDHLIQDFDSSKPNFGDPAEHPELVDLNYTTGQGMDWTHINSVSYNAELDQIALSVHGFSEVWIIDHSTTTEEAAGHTGGRYGRGGDLLYRWGNPRAYRAGLPRDRKLFGQHDVHWIKAGLEGAGDLLIFNNQCKTPEGLSYSSVLEITTPLNPDGSYYMTGSTYGPDEPVWQYEADPPEDFFSMNMSSAQRLPNGNTLICGATQGKFFEITPDGETVWEYQNPFPTLGSNVFRATRYPVDYPGLANLPH
jgi:hypothetical protein